jgi:hypothetical protein
VADEFVYFKYTGRDKEFRAFVDIKGVWVFDPYLKLPVATYDRWRGYFGFVPDIKMVPQAEYDAWADAKAAADAEVFYCGDFGGQTGQGKFCGKRVEGPGQRCEHHGGADEALQGTYPKTDAERPEVPTKRRRGPKKVTA